MKEFCGEIVYYKEDVGMIHSDICHCCNNGMTEVRELTDEDKQFFLDCLKEWLDNTDGTGYFWLGSFKDIVGQE